MRLASSIQSAGKILLVHEFFSISTVFNVTPTGEDDNGSEIKTGPANSLVHC